MGTATGKSNDRSRCAWWPAGLVAVVLGILLVGPAATLLAQQSPAVPLRQFAPGVVTTIPADFLPADTVSTHDIVEIRANKALDWTPELVFSPSRTLYGMSSGVKFRRDVSCLEFSFKPLRMIYVDVPTASGGTGRKQVWYLVYRVRNTGQVLKPVVGEDGVYKAELGAGGPLRFIPQFVLESNDRQPNGERLEKSYLDRVIPAAVAAIRARELPGQELLNSVEMAERTIPVSGDRTDKGVWGVATWTDVDPRMDFFSVYVGGLTNAYQWEDVAGAYKPGDPPGKGRRFAHKMLRLNFWRPGDEMLQDEREIRYGAPIGKSDLYDASDGVAYAWVYR
jgi:hypothetical protein